MVRSAASKIMWVGKATAFLVGLAVILALVFGAASAALGANGDFLKLGNLRNVATNTTALVGKVATGSSLTVKNPSGGSALDLQVGDPSALPSTKNTPPLKVNSEAKVANLNSDELDGKDSSEFAAYKRTVVVSPVGTDTQNGTALFNALSGITDASATKPYLLYIEPGTYDLANGSLSMKPWVDIEGAGELNTVITSSVSSMDCSTGTVSGADNAEMRFLTARNTGTEGGCPATILNLSASPRLTHVTAEITGGGQRSNIAVLNDHSSPTMTDVTATASGGLEGYGVLNIDASPTIRQSKLSGSGDNLTCALCQWGNGTGKVALTQLVGPVTTEPIGGTLRCFNNYDENLAAVTCP